MFVVRIEAVIKILTDLACSVPGFALVVLACHTTIWRTAVLILIYRCFRFVHDFRERIRTSRRWSFCSHTSHDVSRNFS